MNGTSAFLLRHGIVVLIAAAFIEQVSNRLLPLLCRISLTPDSCVRRTQDVVTLYGMRGIVATELIPGLSTLAPVLAGSAGVGTPRFLFFDGVRSLLYVGCFLLVGVLFSRQLEQIMAALASLGSKAPGVGEGAMAVKLIHEYLATH
jgi:membrane protein DedA with SNARE-associated domain